MNYRHGFHAGNHADVVKHVALALALARLGEKAKPMTVVDAFAGVGRYDLLLDEEPGRTNEWREGVARLWPAPTAVEPMAGAEALTPWRSALARENPDGALRRYPGSPVVALGLLRPDDKLLAVERHPEEAERLRTALGRDARARVYEEDAWTALRSFLPPTPRRGLVLIDPPFERTGELDRMGAAIEDGLARWATGVFLLWHARKDGEGVERYLRRVAAAARAAEVPALVAELTVSSQCHGLGASGVVLVNPPYGVADRLDAAGPVLAAALADPGVTTPWRFEWLSPPR